MDDHWLGEYDRLSARADELQAEIGRFRSSQAATSAGAVQASSVLKRKANALASELGGLSNDLAKAADSPTLRITDRELARRKQMLSTLISRKDTIVASLESRLGVDGSPFESTAKAKTWGAPVQETEATKGLTNSDLLSQQQQILQDQDQSVDRLGNILTTTKVLAHSIGSELSEQTVMIDRLGNQVETTDRKIRRENKRIDEFRESDNSGVCVMWIIILVLGALLIALVATHGGRNLIGG